MYILSKWLERVTRGERAVPFKDLRNGVSKAFLRLNDKSGGNECEASLDKTDNRISDLPDFWFRARPHATPLPRIEIPRNYFRTMKLRSSRIIEREDSFGFRSV